MLTAIAAIAENNCIGINGRLMWHLPDDFKRFKMLTKGNTIIMGRKTFESLPGLLPDRTHIIISRQTDYQPKGAIVVHNVNAVLKYTTPNQNTYIIGGGEIYELLMPYTQRLEITQVHSSFEGDTFFPEINTDKWDCSSSIYHPKDTHHKVDFSFDTFQRK